MDIGDAGGAVEGGERAGELSWQSDRVNGNIVGGN